MSEGPISQVEDALKAILQAYAPLAGRTVIIPESTDIALEEGDLGANGALLIFNVSHDVDVADEHWSTIHRAEFEIEAVSVAPASDTISRANRRTLAHVVAAIAQDRGLGIGALDTQEIDVAPAEPRGKGIDGASLKIAVQFFTSRDDWFTILTN